MAGPIDVSFSPTKVNDLANEKGIDWFKNNCIHQVTPGHEGAGRAVYPFFLQEAAFKAINQDLHREKHNGKAMDILKGNLAGVAAHDEFYDEYNSGLDLPAEFYLQTLQTVFMDRDLAKGTLMHEGRPVDMKRLGDTIDIFTVEGEKDDICGLGQTRVLHDLCSNVPDDNKHHHTVKGAGHMGVFSGKKYLQDVLPRAVKVVYNALGLPLPVFEDKTSPTRVGAAPSAPALDARIAVPA